MAARQFRKIIYVSKSYGKSSIDKDDRTKLKVCEFLDQMYSMVREGFLFLAVSAVLPNLYMRQNDTVYGL